MYNRTINNADGEVRDSGDSAAIPRRLSITDMKGGTMGTSIKLTALAALMFASSLGMSQESAPEDAVLRTIAISAPVHFSNSQGEDVLVPSGAYWVTPGEKSLELFSLESGESFALLAIREDHDEDLSDPLALSTGGTEEEPDAHVVAFMFVDATQLVAEGSYSGLYSRGKLALAGRKAAYQIAAPQIAAKQDALVAVRKARKARKAREAPMVIRE